MAQHRALLAWHRTALSAVTAAAVLARHAWEHVGVAGVVPLALAAAGCGLVARGRPERLAGEPPRAIAGTAACLALTVAVAGAVELVVVLVASG